MGSFITNLHVRGAEPGAVVAALQSLDVTPAYVSDAPGAAWVSVFPEPAEQDAHRLQETAAGLSRRLVRPAIAIIVHDSDILWYTLCENGNALDSYDSAPGYFEGNDRPPEGGNVEVLRRYCVSGTTAEPLMRLLHQKTRAPAAPGESDAIKQAVLQMLRDNHKKMAAQLPNAPSLEEMLAMAEKRFASRPPAQAPAAPVSFVFADDMATELGRHLGIAEGRAVDDYRYLASGEGSLDGLLLVEAGDVKPARDAAYRPE